MSVYDFSVIANNAIPTYLSSEGKKHLRDMLRDFPNNINGAFYCLSSDYEDNMLQSDGINNMIFVNVKARIFQNAPGLILSNTCDSNNENNRKIPMFVCYCPILPLENFTTLLDRHNYIGAQQERYVMAVKRQEVSNIFYLPPNEKYTNGGVVFFDQINSNVAKSFGNDFIKENKLFSLSTYGFYIFLIKLSFHFTRMYEGVARGSV